MMHMHYIIHLNMAVFGQLNITVNPSSMKKVPEPGHPWPIRLGVTCEVLLLYQAMANKNFIIISTRALSSLIKN